MAELTARILEGVADIAPADWDACAGEGNPFTRHAFLSAVEESGSATARTGWRPLHIVLDGADGRPAAILPTYLKSHSQGEYVFDHNWADAWHRAGRSYYPKLQHAVPFTPATGPRLLLRDDHEALAPVLLAAAETLARENELSSAHATFLPPDQRAAFEGGGWLVRHDVQFHWFDEGYGDYAGFLSHLSSRKRKALRRERAEAQAGVDAIVQLTGSDLREEHWDAFWVFYQDTGARKWGRPYLTRAFFSLIHERCPERVLLVMARRAGRWVAGALNFIGDDCLYGRHWGCSEDVPFLHFELCYHQAIDWALANGRTRVEAGAQGEHKLARGYRPVATESAHFIADPGFRRAIADYLVRERAGVAAQVAALEGELPFRRSGEGDGG